MNEKNMMCRTLKKRREKEDFDSASIDEMRIHCMDRPILAGVEERHSMVPIEHKYLLTIQEASEYSGIGEKKIRELIRTPHCPFVIYNGTKALIKREKLEKFIDSIEGSI